MWKTSLLLLREALNSHPSLVGNPAGGLGLGLVFTHDVKSQDFEKLVPLKKEDVEKLVPPFLREARGDLNFRFKCVTPVAQLLFAIALRARFANASVQSG
jgi:hypothetical protein